MKCPNESWSPSRPSYTKDHAWKDEATKNNGGSWFNVAHNTTSGKGQNPDGRKKRSRCDCAHPETTASGFAAISVDCPIHGDVDCGPTITTCFPSSRSGGADPMWQRGFQATAADRMDGLKTGGRWFGSYAESKANGTISPGRMHGSKSNGRKMASAMIAKIPPDLSRHIARTFKPR
jgi:hypothetical protein